MSVIYWRELDSTNTAIPGEGVTSAIHDEQSAEPEIGTSNIGLKGAESDIMLDRYQIKI
jgi:hypothetical protein